MRSLDRLATLCVLAPALGQALASDIGLLDKREVVEITNTLGCGAKGTFRSNWAQEFFACTKGSQ